ncbi:MAG: 1,2-phenylacetyl-CoA epoxidase subunit PaaD [Bdellovibrionota bacterium]
MRFSRAELFKLLEEIPDPEIPVINIVELGIVRSVESSGDEATVRITPTYSGCPAMHTIEQAIRGKLSDAGFRSVQIVTEYSPAWTTDWLSDHAKEKLRRYGIAPPSSARQEPLIEMPGKRRRPACPYCGSADTALRSEFGSTACKSMHYCNSCHQPFEHFKAF